MGEGVVVGEMALVSALGAGTSDVKGTELAQALSNRPQPKQRARNA
jgi:hypothetical protein